MGALADLRTKVAGALTPGAGDDWDVHPLPVDAIHPPAYMLAWADPWLSATTHCHGSARLDVVAVANRIDVEPGTEILEQLVEHAWSVLAAAGVPATSTARPIPYEHGGVIYLAARLTLSVPVTI